MADKPLSNINAKKTAWCLQSNPRALNNSKIDLPPSSQNITIGKNLKSEQTQSANKMGGGRNSNPQRLPKNNTLAYHRRRRGARFLRDPFAESGRNFIRIFFKLTGATKAKRKQRG